MPDPLPSETVPPTQDLSPTQPTPIGSCFVRFTRFDKSTAPTSGPCHAFSPNGSLFVICEACHLEVYRTPNFVSLDKHDISSASQASGIRFLPDGSTFWVDFADGSAELFEVGVSDSETGQSIQRVGGLSPSQHFGQNDREQENCAQTDVKRLVDDRPPAGSFLTAYKTGKLCRLTRGSVDASNAGGVIDFGRDIGPDFDCVRLQLRNGRLLAVGRLGPRGVWRRNAPVVAVWSKLASGAKKFSLTLLPGSDGCFTEEGEFVLTWDGPDSPVREGSRRVYVADARETDQLRCWTWSRLSPFRLLDAASAAVFTFPTPHGCTVHRADLLGANREQETPTAAAAVHSHGSRMLLLCTASWLPTAAVYIVRCRSMKHGKASTRVLDGLVVIGRTLLDLCPSLRLFWPAAKTEEPVGKSQYAVSRALSRIDTGLQVPEEQSGRDSVFRWLREGCAMEAAQVHGLLFVKPAQGKPGTIYSFPEGSPVLSIPSSSASSVQFDPTGQFVSFVEESRVTVLSVNSITRPGSDCLTEAFGLMDWLFRLDRLTFLRVTADCLSYRGDIASEIAPWIERGIPRKVDAALNQLDEQRAIAAVASFQKGLLAVVVAGGGVVAHVFELGPEPDGEMANAAVAQALQPVPLTDFDPDRQVYCTFCGEDGENAELTVVQSTPTGARIARILAETEGEASIQLVESSTQHGLRCMKIAADGRSALLLFVDGQFLVLDLEAGGRVRREGSFGAEDREKLAAIIERTPVHIVDDFKTLIPGVTNEEKAELISISLGPRVAFYRSSERSADLPPFDGISPLLWVSADRSRAIVSRAGRAPDDGLQLVELSCAVRAVGTRRQGSCAGGRVNLRRDLKSALGLSTLGMDSIWSARQRRQSAVAPDRDRAFILLGLVAVELEQLVPNGSIVDGLAIDLSGQTLDRLRERFGRALVVKRDANGKSLLHHLITQSDFKAAARLIGFALEDGMEVTFCWRNEDGKHTDAVSWALDNLSENGVRFVVDSLGRRCTTVEETAFLAKKLIYGLHGCFPRLLIEFIKDNRFTFELGRCEVPESMFHKTHAKKQLATQTRQMLSWEPKTQSETLEFWKKNHPSFATRYEDAGGTMVKALWMFVCVEDLVAIGGRGIVSWLSRLELSRSTVQCDLLRRPAYWIWYDRRQKPMILCGVAYLIAAACFFFFAANFGTEDGGEKSAYKDESLAALVVSTVALWILCVKGMVSRAKVPSCAILAYLLIYAVFNDKHSGTTAFLTSLECLSFFLAVSNRPLCPAGSETPVAFAGTVLRAALPIDRTIRRHDEAERLGRTSFAAMVLLIVVGFGSAFYVLFRDSDLHEAEKAIASKQDEVSEDWLGVRVANRIVRSLMEDTDPFGTFFLSCETVFHAFLGQFEAEAFHGAGGSFSKWRTVLLNLLLFLGHIVLLNLLIAILSNTYDRIRWHEDAELITSKIRTLGCWSMGNRMHSADISFAGTPEFGGYFHFLTPADSLRRDGDQRKWSGRLRMTVDKVGERVCEEMKRWSDCKMGRVLSEMRDVRADVAALSDLTRQILDKLPAADSSPEASEAGKAPSPVWRPAPV